MMGRLWFRIGGSYSTDCLAFVSEPLAYSVEVSALVFGELTISDKIRFVTDRRRSNGIPSKLIQISPETLMIDEQVIFLMIPCVPEFLQTTAISSGSGG
ncbi:unnamed protein product [Cochlearia groenlandica]